MKDNYIAFGGYNSQLVEVWNLGITPKKLCSLINNYIIYKGLINIKNKYIVSGSYNSNFISIWKIN